MKNRSIIRILLFVPVFLLGSLRAGAQAFTVLHAFDPNTNQGFGPGRGLMKGQDGNLYGLAVDGLNSLTLFYQLTPGGTYTKLHEFTQAETPVDVVAGADGNFYGVGATGTNLLGIYYKIDTSGTVTVLHDFTNADPYFGAESIALGGDGNLYALGGGATGYGSIWKLTPGGGVTQLYLVPSNTDPNGVYLLYRLADGADGYLYGTSSLGGANSAGTFYRISYSGVFQKLHDFAPNEQFFAGGIATDEGLVKAADGNFYIPCSGCNNNGAIYRLTTAGTVSLVTSAFGGSNQQGTAPAARLLQGSDGNLYGTTLTAGNLTGSGSLYQLTPSGSLTFFHIFLGTDGFNIEAPLIQGDDGFFYGAASQGGANQGAGFAGGTAFRASVPPSVLTIAPSSGPAAGSTAVTIGGTSFVSGATVTIGGVPATGVGFTNATTLQATTPALSPGTLDDVQVTNPDTSFGIGQRLFFADFLDVTQADIFHSFVEKVFRNGITAGCGGGNYCRNNPVRRDQMAVFLLKAEHGASYVPPVCTGVFPDVPCPGTFTDWIEQLAAEHITGGCGGGNYCPGNPVTRQQMAVFLLKTEHGSAYVPPACVGIFGDVPCPSQFADWIEQLYAENVTGGCSTSPLLYCPTNSNTRGQMAVFLTKTFQLP